MENKEFIKLKNKTIKEYSKLIVNKKSNNFKCALGLHKYRVSDDIVLDVTTDKSENILAAFKIYLYICDRCGKQKIN